jgi:hypothetical protein
VGRDLRVFHIFFSQNKKRFGGGRWFAKSEPGRPTLLDPMVTPPLPGRQISPECTSLFWNFIHHQLHVGWILLHMFIMKSIMFKVRLIWYDFALFPVKNIIISRLTNAPHECLSTLRSACTHLRVFDQWKRYFYSNKDVTLV